MEQSGFINIDKPVGKTSHDVCDIIRKMLNIEKCGHAGTLDPQVSGVLPIAIGKATRLLRYLEHDKEYVGIMYMHEDVPLRTIKSAIKKHFLGKIIQLPPRKSRVKREEREREIYSFDILEKDKKKVLFKVHCQAGTYIRKLVHDLGEKLKGAHMIELRRTRAGFMDEKNSITLYQLKEAFEKNNDFLMPMEIIAKKMPKIHINEQALERLYNGSPIYKEFITKKSKLKKDEFAAVMLNKKLVEIARIVLEDSKIAVPETVIKD